MLQGRLLRSLLLLSLVVVPKCFAPPVSMFHDTVIFHEGEGPNPYPDKERKKHVNFSIIPYYRNIHNAKSSNGTKVAEGDVLGRWNMIGLLHGTAAAPGGNLTSTPLLDVASKSLTQAGYPPSNYGNTLDRNYTDTNFTDSSQQFGYFTIPIDAEKFGVRGGLDILFGAGFGLKIKGGFTHYRQSPSFEDLTSTASENSVGYTVVNSASFADDKTITQTVLMNNLNGIADEIGLNIDQQNKTELEDTYVALYWSGRVGMKNAEGEHVVSVIPYLEGGAWLPTGAKKHQDVAFSLATGNDGFFGGTVDGGLNFDFLETIQLGLGGGVAFFETKTINEFRVPSSDTQSAVYPWKTKVRRRLGASWYAHVGMKAEDFVDNLSGYITYVFARHEHDNIFVQTDPSNFVPARLEKDTSWTSQVIHGGVEYKVAEELRLGFGVQAPLTGKKVYRGTTLFGNVKFTF